MAIGGLGCSREQNRALIIDILLRCGPSDDGTPLRYSNQINILPFNYSQAENKKILQVRKISYTRIFNLNDDEMPPWSVKYVVQPSNLLCVFTLFKLFIVNFATLKYYVNRIVGVLKYLNLQIYMLIDSLI